MVVTMKRAVPRRRAIAAILFASALLVVGVGGTPAAAQTLTEAIHAALRNNPEVGVVAADREAVEQVAAAVAAGTVGEIPTRVP